MIRRAPRLVCTVLALFVGQGLLACGGDPDVNTDVAPSNEATCPCRLATQFENLALCVSPTTAFAPTHVYSTSWSAGENKPVCEPYREPQPQPSAAWSKVQVSSACQGTGQLCLTVRAGKADALSSDDCTLAMRCSDIAYGTPNQIADLAPLAGWVAESSACAQRHEQLGAYIELSLRSEQLGCGMGLEQVSRIPVCPSRCQENALAAGCETCGQGTLQTTL